MNSINHTLLVAAFSGTVFGAGYAHANPSMSTANGATMASDNDKHSCKGQNACKGKGGCKTDKHACKGQNACKGQGGCKAA
ncbi:MAG TPA: hypothetical protein VIV60_18440 [Polyangiaceae bacterium]